MSNEPIIIALISAGSGTLVSCLFQLINRILNDRKEERSRVVEKKNIVYDKKEEVYLAAIERLQQVRRGFDITREEANRNKDLLEEIKAKEVWYEPLAAKLRLYASDEIFNEYYHLMFYSKYVYAPSHGPRLFEVTKEAFNRQILVLSRRMQVELGIRQYNNDNTEITCPECDTKHDAFDDCPRCKMKYSEYMRRMQFSVLEQVNDVKYLTPYQKEGYDSYFILKFMEKREFQKLFIEGKLYFNTSDYFMMCDEEGRGDTSEGNAWEINSDINDKLSANLTIVGGKALIEVIDYSNNPEDYQQGTIYSYSPAENRNRKIISFSTLYTDTKSNKVQPIPENMNNEFGEYGVLITDAVEFYNRLIEGIKKRKTATKIQLGYVEYIKDDNSGFTEFNPFRKKEKYAYQNEFRATFIDDTRDHVIIDVGDLSDIAKPLFKDGLKEIFMKDGKLNYPKYVITE